MWRLLEYLLLAGIVLLAITEFFYPLLSGKPFFGSFRKKKMRDIDPAETGTLNQKVNQAKAKVQQVKKVQDEVDQHYKSAEQLKEESDQLLNKPPKKETGSNDYSNN